MINLKIQWYVLAAWCLFFVASAVATATFAYTNYNANSANSNAHAANANTNANTNTSLTPYQLNITDSDFLKKFTNLPGYQGVAVTLQLPYEQVSYIPNITRTTLASTQDILTTKYSSDKLLLTSTYQALDASRLKQKYEVKNNLGKSVLANLTLQYQINTSQIIWDKKTHTLTTTPQNFTPYVAKIPENLKTYFTATYYNGAEIGFGNYSMNFHDLVTSGYTPQVSAFIQGTKNILQIKLSFSLPAYGTKILDPILKAEDGAGAGTQDRSFVRGRVNNDSNIDISDGIAIFNWLFVGGQEPGCRKAADVNDDGEIDISDGIYLLGFLFLGGDEPKSPYPALGVDPSPDGLTCISGIPVTPGQAVIGPEGGTVTSADEHLTLDIPSGALSEILTFSITETTEFTDRFLGTVYDIGPNGTIFSAPAQLTLQYDEPSLPPGTDEGRLMLATIENGQLKLLPTTREAAANALGAEITHLTPFGATDKVAIILNSPAGVYSLGTAGFDNIQVGWGQREVELRALMWSSTPDSAIDLTPTGHEGSGANAAWGSTQGGWGRKEIVFPDGGWRIVNHALTWSGSPANATDLHPGQLGWWGWNSEVTDIWENIQVGWAEYYSEKHAVSWRGSAAGMADLHPTNFTESAAVAVHRNTQLGWGTAENGGRVALRWHGTRESAEVLPPLPGFQVYELGDIWEDNMVGTGIITGGRQRRALLVGESTTTVEFVDLHPERYFITSAQSIWGNTQVGWGIGPGSDLSTQQHALLWYSSPVCVVDLHQFVPPEYSESEANSIDMFGNVVGSAWSNSRLSTAVLWKTAELITPAVGEFDLDVDTDRDGVVEDGEDEAGEADWSSGPGSRGAIILANSDDDVVAPAGGGPAVKDNKPDNWLGRDLDGDGMFTDDSADTVVNGPDDVQDIGPLWVRKSNTGELPADLVITLSVFPVAGEDPYFAAIHPEERVRIFLPSKVNANILEIQDGDKEIMGPVTGYVATFIKNPNPDPAANEYSFDVFQGCGIVKFGIEGITFGAPVSVRLAVTQGGAAIQPLQEVQLKVAPFIAATHRQTVDVTSPVGQTVYVADRATNNADLRGKLSAKYGARLREEVTFADPWHQDPYEIGYTQAPYQQLQIVFGLPRGSIDQEFDGTGGFNEYARNEVMRNGVGLIAGFYNLPFNNQNDGGNFEVQPTNSFGRIVFGTNDGSFDGSIDPNIFDFLQAQGMQTVISDIDLRWLLLGHMDETVSFPSAVGSRARVASPEAAWALLVIAKDVHGGGGAVMTRDMNGNGPAGVTVNNILDDTDGVLDTIRHDNFDSTTGYAEGMFSVRNQLGLTPPVTEPNDTLSNAKLRRVGYLEVYDGIWTPFAPTEWKLTFTTADDFSIAYRTLGDAIWIPDGSGKRSEDAVSASKAVYIVRNWWEGPAAVAGNVVTFETRPSPDMIELPVLFYRNTLSGNTGAQAFTGNVANAIVDGATIFIPMPNGPEVLPSDIFQDYVTAAVRSAGFSDIVFIDDVYYHNLCGSIHCGTNVMREIPASKWWEQ